MDTNLPQRGEDIRTHITKMRSDPKQKPTTSCDCHSYINRCRENMTRESSRSQSYPQKSRYVPRSILFWFHQTTQSQPPATPSQNKVRQKRITWFEIELRSPNRVNSVNSWRTSWNQSPRSRSSANDYRETSCLIERSSYHDRFWCVIRVTSCDEIEVSCNENSWRRRSTLMMWWLTTAQIWTDGSCEGNPGPGGWGFIVLFKVNCIYSVVDWLHQTNGEGIYRDEGEWCLHFIISWWWRVWVQNCNDQQSGDDHRSVCDHRSCHHIRVLMWWQMELMAAISALQWLQKKDNIATKPRVKLMTDSKYVLDGITSWIKVTTSMMSITSHRSHHIHHITDIDHEQSSEIVRRAHVYGRDGRIKDGNYPQGNQ